MIVKYVNGGDLSTIAQRTEKIINEETTKGNSYKETVVLPPSKQGLVNMLLYFNTPQR